MPRRSASMSHQAARLLILAAAAACLFAPAPRPASYAAGAPQAGDAAVLKIDTDLVLVDVTVTDAAGRAVRGLRPADFKLYEDGEERAVAFLNVERRGGAERPVAVVFAVDVSGSMTPEEMLRLQTAMRAFSDKLSNRPV